MAFIEKIEDDEQRELAELVSAHHRYRFVDGFTMFIATSPAWCRACQAFVTVEKLLDPAEKVARAHECYEIHDSEPLISLGPDPVSEKRERNRKRLAESLYEAERWRAALSERKSPPRCLECGGTDFVTIRDDGTWAPHPAARHRKVRVPRDEASFASRRDCGRLYDAEGRRISA